MQGVCHHEGFVVVVEYHSHGCPVCKLQSREVVDSDEFYQMKKDLDEVYAYKSSLEQELRGLSEYTQKVVTELRSLKEQKDV
jgi:hypothetical protein